MKIHYTRNDLSQGGLFSSVNSLPICIQRIGYRVTNRIEEVTCQDCIDRLVENSNVLKFYRLTCTSPRTKMGGKLRLVVKNDILTWRRDDKN